MILPSANRIYKSTRSIWPNAKLFFDEPMLTREDGRQRYGEQRLVSLAWFKGEVVVLVWADRDDGPRLISCRKAETYERQTYFKAFPQI